MLYTATTLAREPVVNLVFHTVRGLFVSDDLYYLTIFHSSSDPEATEDGIS
jgi:hypothetical protein